MKKYYYGIGGILLLLVIGFLTINQVIPVMQKEKKEEKKVIVIDAGHGGFDPGKVGIHNELEKDINLEIALKLKKILEKNNFRVIMTRKEDKGLYQEGDSNKKRTDMRKRVEIVNSSGAVLAISIHQNSYPQESVKGAQVFYHGESEEGKKLAGLVQQKIKETINDGNHRVEKANESYYMLKKTECPIIIVECGFLSNSVEAQLLTQEAYQEKMACAIQLGISSYLE